MLGSKGLLIMFVCNNLSYLIKSACDLSGVYYFSINRLAFYHKFCSLIGCSTHYLYYRNVEGRIHMEHTHVLSKIHYLLIILRDREKCETEKKHCSYNTYIIDTMHFLGITFYSYSHVPYRNITHQHANMLEEKESWIIYFYKKSMYKICQISLALDKLLLQLYICFRDGLRSKGTMLLQIGKEGKI